MRRKDRETPEDFAWGVADACAWACIALVTPGGEPYSVPVSIARDGKSLYFHCAREGFKTDCLRFSPSVCVVCVGRASPAKDKFTTDYESAILRGRAVEAFAEEEKIRALRLICERYTPENMAAFDEAISRSLARTAVWRIDVEEISGKRKKFDANGREIKSGKN